jgi:hypothetical protein
VAGPDPLGSDVADVATAERVNDLLLPIVKGVGSERASEQLVQSLQTLGGSGYLQDYPIEQYVRDAKIDSLYEGTTAIQSLDFLFRKIVRDNGAALGVVVAEIQGSSRPSRATGGSRRSARFWPPRSATCRACWPRSPGT